MKSGTTMLWRGTLARLDRHSRFGGLWVPNRRATSIAQAERAVREAGVEFLGSATVYRLTATKKEAGPGWISTLKEERVFHDRDLSRGAFHALCLTFANVENVTATRREGFTRIELDHTPSRDGEQWPTRHLVLDVSGGRSPRFSYRLTAKGLDQEGRDVRVDELRDLRNDVLGWLPHQVLAA